MLGNRQVTRLLQVALFLALVGCGKEEVDVPAACVESPAAIRSALKSAPSDVLLAGNVKISDCFQPAASQADVQNLGTMFLAAAQELADDVRRSPRSHEAIELGYLVGAVHRAGAIETGIHYETGRRVDQEVVGVPRTRQYRDGLAAGRRSG